MQGFFRFYRKRENDVSPARESRPRHLAGIGKKSGNRVKKRLHLAFAITKIIILSCERVAAEVPLAMRLLPTPLTKLGCGCLEPEKPLPNLD
jgi:hypothetical protein